MRWELPGRRFKRTLARRRKARQVKTDVFDQPQRGFELCFLSTAVSDLNETARGQDAQGDPSFLCLRGSGIVPREAVVSTDLCV